MEKITSFTIDHLKLQPGVYVSRIDYVEGHPVTTFDLRMTSPNEEPVMNTAEMHTIEHLAATFLRNHPEFGRKTIYFGPMGCRTGFYLLLAGEQSSAGIIPLMKEMYTFIVGFEGEVPGAHPKDCGNYLDMNLPMAKYLANKYLSEVLENITEDRLVYPQ
ncbi:MAG: S-ribosylhomocysteine lyase [Dorea sp.]|nr:S-ribosylhomocysteine lyase [Dorea sp.]